MSYMLRIIPPLTPVLTDVPPQPTLLHVYDKVYKPYLGKNSFTFFPALLRPKSRGTVRLKSDDPYEDPLIDFNLFQYEEDLDKVVDSKLV
ncbi:hypothetical protein AVEN_81721-1 [Araneus ventricosus]|uniref:Glucose-methanol-choline oxidoreductase C-terminal domain-containing protein n=1 Tax=Araneus ventricosus TaxID=182803 RepID=A0A4Y2W5K6_ARAVE|nr:hypothetical protein AVEN_81721-1 [Araneus ventricosus]